MKRFILIPAILACFVASAQDSFERGLLQDKTLRVDYIFTGTDKTAEISLSELACFDGWSGRRVNMDQVPVLGNGQISMKVAETGEVLYRSSFSTLFQEWQTSEEASRVKKSFENTYLLPMPGVKAEITVELYDFWNKPVETFTHVVDPSDILIRQGGQHLAAHKYLLKSGSSKDCIDVAFISEGYSKKEMKKFYKNAQAGVDALLSHEPFKSMKDRFNFIAIFIPSNDSGISVPHEGQWYDTAVGAHFDTFYTQRYLTTLKITRLHDKIEGLPYEHLLILANTETYGGGGIYNSYTLTNAHNPHFQPVLVHEFGHSFGALADEYYYDDQYVNYYYSDVEPWEQNITTLYDFQSKWADMLEEGTPIPTQPVDKADCKKVGVFEGAGYMSKGCYRPTENCRMHTNAAEAFCPVCERAIRRIIDFYTVQK